MENVVVGNCQATSWFILLSVTYLNLTYTGPWQERMYKTRSDHYVLHHDAAIQV